MNDSPIIAIVGFGSLGTLFASLLAPNMPFENLRIVADTDRVNRYQQQGLLVNGEPLTLNYVTPNAITTPPSASTTMAALKRRRMRANPAAFESVERKAVTGIGAPS